MKFLPYDKFIIKTNFSPNEVRQIFQEFVDKPKWFRWFTSNNKPYQGNVTDNNFKITRIINYRNSFIPVIIGNIQAVNNDGSIINVTMRAYYAIYLFILAWFFIPIYMLLDTIGNLFFNIIFSSSKYNYSIIGIIFPIAFMIFGYLIIYIGYKIEAK